MELWGFSATDAARIASAVQAVERDRSAPLDDRNPNAGPVPWLGDIPFCNASEEIPAGAVFVDNGAWDIPTGTRTVILKARKLTTTAERPLYVAGPSTTAAGAIGYALLEPRVPVLVAYDTADGTPAAGQEWGPLAGGYKLRAAGNGFKILAPGNNGFVWAIRKAEKTPRWFRLILSDATVQNGEIIGVSTGVGGDWRSTADDYDLDAGAVVPSKSGWHLIGCGLRGTGGSAGDSISATLWYGTASHTMISGSHPGQTYWWMANTTIVYLTAGEDVVLRYYGPTISAWGWFFALAIQ